MQEAAAPYSGALRALARRPRERGSVTRSTSARLVWSKSALAFRMQEAAAPHRGALLAALSGSTYRRTGRQGVLGDVDGIARLESAEIHIGIGRSNGAFRHA